ncbi:MAG TPA: PKD domain-containing protein [Bacteroidia bacterium]|nr:PKD domain-containing protein [Bacteroidia bacterium]
MKKLFLFIACGIVMPGIASAQTASHCPNTNFESGNFSNWLGYTGSCCPVSATVPGIVYGRHTILSAPQGTDQNTCGGLQITPSFVGGRVCRLGNDNIWYEAERLVYSMTVDQYNALFVYRYAVVLEDPGHPTSDQPNFRIRVLDALGNVIDPVCGQYFVQAAANIPGFQTSGSVIWKDWTMVGISLSAYIGQTVTIEFATGDCGYGGHFGYAYLDCFCMPMAISMEFCPGANTVTLIAPPGFPSYLWSTGATTQSVVINNPYINQQVTCLLTTVQNCNLMLTTTLQSTIITPAFSVSANPCANPVPFADLSSIVNGNLVSWHWNFGDGSPIDTNQNPLHLFPASGTYNVTLWVYSVSGCVDSITQTITIAIPPVANFSSTVVCAGNATVFSDLSTSQNNQITNWNWNFGDMSTDTAQNPQHIYFAAGNYNAMLIIINAAGCSDTIIHTVTVNPNPLVSVSSANVAVCTGQNTTLTASGANSYVWSPSATLSSSTGNSVTANPVATTLYTVTGTTNGCTASAQVSVTVNPLPVLVTSPDVTVCKGDTTILTASGANTYSWSPSIWLSATTGDTVIAVPFSTTTYLVTATDINGCTSTASITVTVNPTISVPPVVLVFDTLFCVTGYVTYQWYFNAVIIPGATNYYYVVTQTGSYTVEVTDSNGCRGSSGFYVLITGALENSIDYETLIYPTPFSTTATLILRTGTFHPEILIRIYDVPGRIAAAERIHPDSYNSQTGETKVAIHRNNLSAGMYFYKVSAEKGIIASGKMIIE